MGIPFNSTALGICCNYFLSQVIFVFLLVLGMVMYANEHQTREKEKLPEIKN